MRKKSAWSTTMVVNHFMAYLLAHSHFRLHIVCANYIVFKSLFPTMCTPFRMIDKAHTESQWWLIGIYPFDCGLFQIHKQTN